MPRQILLSRTQADALLDLLEDCDPAVVGTWRHDLADEIRTAFGYCSIAESKRRDAEKQATETGRKE